MKLDEIKRKSSDDRQRTFAEIHGENLEGERYADGINVSRSGMTSLEGCPTYVRKFFTCTNNRLTSLKHGPRRVGEAFNVSENPLETLEGAPDFVNGDFILYKCNALRSLDGIPPEAEYVCLSVEDCPSLKSLGVLPAHLENLIIIKCPIERLGDAFSRIETMRNIRLIDTNMTSISDDFPKFCNFVRIVADIPSLHDIHRHFKYVKCFNLETNTKESILGLALIEGLGDDSHFSFDVDGPDGRSRLIRKIVLDYVGKGKQVLMSFQNELLDNGFEEFAKL